MIVMNNQASIRSYVVDSLDTIEITFLTFLVNLWYQDVHDGGITRKHIISAMKRRNYDYSLVIRFELCLKRFLFRCCSKHGITRIPTFCGFRFCPVCAYLRTKRLYHKYVTAFDENRDYTFLTLTMGVIPINRVEPIKFHHKQVVQFMNFLKRTYGVRGGMIFTELSPEYRLHYHLLLDCGFIPQNCVSCAWSKFSEGNYIAHISRVRASQALTYLLDYSSKVPEFASANDYLNYYEMTKGVRLLTTFGKFYRIKAPLKKRRVCECSVVYERSVFTPDEWDKLFKGVQLKD